MGSLLLELAITYLEYSLGQEDEGGQMPALAFRQQAWNILSRIRGPWSWRIPRTPRTPPTIPSGPVRPGLPVAIAVGAGAMVHKVGKFVWLHKWWLPVGVGAYLLGSYVRTYLQRRRSDREQHAVTTHANYTSAITPGCILDGSALLSAYLEDLLKSGRLQDLDICHANTFFEEHLSQAQSVAIFCVEHLYLQVRNHVDPESEMSSLLQVAFERVRRMLFCNESLDMVSSESYSLCIQSKNRKTVGLIITGNLGTLKQWYCCSGSICNPIEISRPLSELSYLASRRLAPSLQSLFCTSEVVFETIPDGPEYIILAGGSIIDVLQNLRLLEFAYQGVRPGINIRDLCDTLHQLSVPSASPSENLLIVIVQFKPPQHRITLQPDDIARRKGKAPMDSGEGPSGTKTD